jgi:hypothetical protein
VSLLGADQGVGNLVTNGVFDMVAVVELDVVSRQGDGPIASKPGPGTLAHQRLGPGPGEFPVLKAEFFHQRQRKLFGFDELHYFLLRA